MVSVRLLQTEDGRLISGTRSEMASIARGVAEIAAGAARLVGLVRLLLVVALAFECRMIVSRYFLFSSCSPLTSARKDSISS
jgi:hypothetical protein